MQAAALGVVAVGLVGLPLLLIGWFKSYLVLPGAFALWLVLVVLRGRALAASRRSVPLSAHIVSAVALVASAVNVVDNARSATQHLLVDGDPAVYGMTGKWIATHGSLNIPIHPSWFGNDPTINYMTNGFFLRSDGQHLYPQFFHLLPALLAIADWFHGTGALLLLNTLLGGFALLAVYAFGTRLMKPVWALGAMVTLSMTLPQLFFTRDTFSEIPSQFLIFAGLALLFDATSSARRRPGLAGLLAGLTLGASTMARIDAFLYLLPLTAAMFALVLVLPRDDPRRPLRTRTAYGVAAGLTVSGLVAVLDGAFGSPTYAKSVTGELIGISVATVFVVMVGFGLLHRPALEDRIRGVITRLGRITPIVCGSVITVGFLFAWLVRPHVQKVHETGVLNVAGTIAAYQRNEHVTVDPTRHYNEMSLRWLSWYVGPITLTLAILGLGYLTYRVLSGRDLQLLPFLLLGGVVTAVYVYDPAIVPVQYWATRRFLPVTFPVLILVAFLLLSRLWEYRRGLAATLASARLVRPVARAAAVLLAVAVVATPIILLRGPTRLVKSYVPVRDVVNRICAALQPSDVVLLVGYSSRTNGFVQTIETYCGNMAAVSGPQTSAANVQSMKAAVAASGHRLVLISEQQKPIDQAGHSLGVTLGTTLTIITFATEAQSLSHRPDSVFAPSMAVYFAVAP
ncbi:MAG: hypothetical protein QOJ62_1580 [Actinomycetota bacterium]|nr:hypothetical protein [Actinomycetota bacterium]